MKTSVLVIAHNEEKHIGHCLQSLLKQNKKVDEIVLVLHNSTDKTKDIAEKYPVKIINFQGPVGIPYARMEGLNHVSGDIILCIDGDSFAMNNWVEEMTATLKSGNILVGSWVKSRGTFFGSLSNAFTKYLCLSKGMIAVPWIWGASVAFWGTDMDKVHALWQKSIQISNELKLTRSSDDLWLAFYMNKRGKLETTNKTHVINYSKEISSSGLIKRYMENIRNGIRIFKWFRARGILHIEFVPNIN